MLCVRINIHQLTWGIRAIGLGALIFFVGLSISRRALHERMFRKGGPFRTTHTLTLTEEAIITENNHTRAVFPFVDVLRVLQDPGYVYVYIDNAVAFYVPTRAFQSLEEKTKFVEAVSSRVVEAKRALAAVQEEKAGS